MVHWDMFIDCPRHFVGSGIYVRTAQSQQALLWIKRKSVKCFYYDALDKWNVTNRVVGISFDATSSITGRHDGTFVYK